MDNLGVLGFFRKEVADTLDEVTQACDQAGLPTHERDLTGGATRALGALIDCEHWTSQPTLARLWRIRRGCSWALKCRKLPGRVWEILLGHMTFLGLSNRDSLSAFCALYKFVEAHYWEPMPLWPTARDEVRAFLGVLCLFVSDWTLQWCPYPMASDASEDGYGICWGTWDAATLGKNWSGA